jgi:CubicO group peptidase (beta-lactamase class C family)
VNAPWRAPHARRNIGDLHPTGIGSKHGQWRILLSFVLVALFGPSARAQEPFEDPALDAAVQSYLKRKAIPGAVVGIVDGDKLLYKKAFGLRDVKAGTPMTTDTLFQIGSMTKSMTAELMGMLRDDGKLKFDDPIGKYVPKKVKLPPALRRITLRQLATHTAGLPRNFVNRQNVPGSPSVAMPYSIKELYEGLPRTELTKLDGKSRYSNVGPALLGHILELVSGTTYEKLLRDRLLSPLGMSSTGIQPTPEQEKRLAVHYWKGKDDPPIARERWVFGEVAGNGGVFSCVDDLAKYVILQYAGSDDGPVRTETLAELHTPVVRFEDSSRTWLGIGWFIYKLPKDTIIHHDGGVDGNSASIAFVREKGLGVIALTNRGGDTAADLAKTVLRFGMQKLRK